MKKEIKRDYPEEMKLMNNCPNCGQEVNIEFVERVIDDIVKQARQQERERIIEEIENYYKDTPIKDIPDYTAFYKAITNKYEKPKDPIKE